MSTTVTHHCDVCGGKMQEPNKSDLIPHDICTHCQRKIIAKVIEGQYFLLRPYCKTCGGSGVTETSDLKCDGRVERTIFECTHCKL